MMPEREAFALQRAFKAVRQKFDIQHAFYRADGCECLQCRIMDIALSDDVAGIHKELTDAR